MRIENEITIQTAQYLFEHLRAEDKREVDSLGVVDFSKMPQLPEGRTFFNHNGEPVAVLGFQEVLSGVFNIWMLGTDDFTRYGKGITKHVLFLLKTVEHRRAQAIINQHAITHIKWLERLGFKIEGTLKQYGINGDDFLIMARVSDE